MCFYNGLDLSMLMLIFTSIKANIFEYLHFFNLFLLRHRGIDEFVDYNGSVK